MSAALLAALAGGAVGCGGESNPAPSAPAPSAPSAGFVITISNFSFSPLHLRVPPGAVVTVVNQDAMLHSVTSEPSDNAFRAGSVGGVAFDTGQFTGSRSFTIPSNALNGTTIPYFCRTHLGTMNTPNGSITIDTSAQPSSGGAGGGGAGGGGGGGGY